MTMKITAAAALVAVSAAACASAPDDIQPRYMASTPFMDLSCEQIATQMQSTAGQVEKVTGKQLAKRRTDQTATGVGLVLFWPALILLPLTPDHKKELARLKGEYEAETRAAEAKHCKAV